MVTCLQLRDTPSMETARKIASNGELRAIAAAGVGFVADPFNRRWHANGQPAFGRYLRDPHAPVGHAHGLIVLTLAGNRISAITGFNDNSVLARFGLPRTLPE